MKRRDTIKTLLVGGIAGVTISTQSCKTDVVDKTKETLQSDKGYGRTPDELAHDKKVKEEVYLDAAELTTIAALCDIILPATKTAGSAVDAKVPEFIDFIVKDLPYHQLPIRGGIMWLHGESNKRYGKIFNDLADHEQIAIIDDIAYPDPDNKKPEMGPGISFFTRMRNLCLTGYYTTKMGFDDLGYVGNRANAWDGVPQEVLDKHGMAYPESWMPKFVNQETRNVQAEWDEQGNLLT